MSRKMVLSGLALVGLVAGTARPATATSWGGNGSYCAGSDYITCFSVDLSWTANVATLTVTNDGSEGDLIKAIGITSLDLPDGWNFTLGGQAGYCRAGQDQGCPNEIGGTPPGNGQFPLAAVAATNSQGSMPGDGQSGTWTFTFSGFGSQSDLDNALAGASVGGHFISGPNDCSTKWAVTPGKDFTNGPTLDSCGGGESTVPEPATMLLMASGLVGMGGATLFRRRKQQG